MSEEDKSEQYRLLEQWVLTEYLSLSNAGFLQFSIWNDVFGYSVAYPYYHFFLVKHITNHNRFVGGGVILAAVYACLIE